MATNVRVLIVDDDPSLRNILTLMLKGMHYELAGVATSRQEAEEKALSLKPDVIIMDVVMETRHAGIEAAAKIAESIHIPIIYLTTDAEEGTLTQALETEPFGYLLKPIQADNLRAAIEISMLRYREEISMRIYQEALEEANHLFKGIFSTMQNGYYRVNLDEKIMLANPAFLDILGYDPTENLTGKTIKELGFSDEKDRTRLLNEVSKKGLVQLHESEWRHKSGSAISVLENVQAFHDDTDKLQYFEGTVQDITPMRVLQQQLQLSQKMEIIGIMASRIAHELNNKLTTILGYADLCAIKLPNDHEIYKYIQHIQNYSKHSAGVIQQLLKFSRKPEAQEPTNFDVNDFLQERREIIEAICTRSITVLTHADLENPLVFADKKQFEQVIINLVINARDAMPEGGTLTFQLSNECYEQSSRNSSVAPHGDYIKISLTDTGTGIPEKNLAKIFEPFFTTKKEGVGTGLGLSIVKGIIESNKGFVEVISTPDIGTTFEILLPSFIPEA
jgi:two-component system cell cycle sensor histidine kinase/response regulator CckA